jgi:amino acid transporter
MFFRRLFATKSLEMLHAEMAEDEGRLRRVLGPVGLTSLGVGAIIGAGIFVMTGRAAANDAGPAIMLSFAIAGVGCALAAFCYAEFASLAPVAGSAYTYAYATLGELLAWIIGWDLVLEYAMSCATVAASWSKYLNELLLILFGPEYRVPDYLCHDPFSHPGAWFNLPAVLILGVVTVILVIGIRESAASNTALVLLKLSVVLFVIVVGAGYVSRANWFDIPAAERKTAEQILVPAVADELARDEEALSNAARNYSKLRFGKQGERVVVELAGKQQGGLAITETGNLDERADRLRGMAVAVFLIERAAQVEAKLAEDGALTPAVKDRLNATVREQTPRLPGTDEDRARVRAVLDAAREQAPEKATAKWGLLGKAGFKDQLEKIDDSVRSNFMPYGLSGLMLGASIVFFAFIGFDSISTHAEEAVRPQRDVPIGILASLVLCTVLYIVVSGVITGMQEYQTINTETAIASAFRNKSEQVEGGSPLLKAAAGLIATGALAGMTSVLLITFLSQARVFLAMARDKLLPPNVFGVVHPKFKTPHISTMLTGCVICTVAAFTPILVLEEMVNIGTLFAFVIVCAAVLILRIKRPEAKRPFRCPLVYVVAPLGIAVNLLMMLFLPVETWLRLIVWLGIGLVIYLGYGYRHSRLGALAKADATRAKV